VPFAPKWTAEAEATFLKLQADAAASLRNRQTKKQAKATKAEGLFKQVNKSVDLLLQNPRHPGLKTHEYASIPSPYKEGEKVFEAYAQNNTPGAYRIFWCYGPNKSEITVLAITPHP
jgi:uncharacterized iron-regulated protein